MPTSETRRRSLTKTVTYRIAIIVADIVIIFIMTRRLDVTIGVTALTNIASSILYYGHERLWSFISWGNRQ